MDFYYPIFMDATQVFVDLIIIVEIYYLKNL